MKWPEVLLAPVRCELKAQYGLGGWQLSAKGALPVVLLMIAMMAVCWR